MSFFSRLFRVGTLPEPLRAQLEPEGIIHVAEKVRVRERFSGGVPGRHDALGVNRHIGLVVFTRQRLYALLPSLQMLKQPAIDQRWDAPHDGPARVEISDSGVKLEIVGLQQVDPRFHGDLSLDFRTSLPDETLAALPSRSLAFAVSPEYVFHMLGVRAKP
ncbi:MAG TPA: hypothetical protein VFB19_16770 [Mycobacterium sp.]|nr:hypothetical protein [Mycobacterium sp.]